MTTTRALIGVAAVVLLGGCMSPRYYPPASGERVLVPDMGTLSETEMENLRKMPVAAREPAAAGIAWIVDVSAGGAAGDLPESERVALVASLATALGRAPFSSVEVLPTTAAGSGSPGDGRDLRALRSAAARFQRDVLVVVSTHRNQYDDWNPLAVTYLALLPRWFVPGNSLAVYASAEVCAVDVGSGLFLACAQGQGKAERALVTAIGREQRLRELSAAALRDAFGAVPDVLLQGVQARLARRPS